MKVLVTGGLGFIGTNYVRYFLGKYKNDKIVVLDKLTYAANRFMLNEFKNFSNFKFIKGDITNFVTLEKVFRREKFDYVINLAAETNVDKSYLDEITFYETNVIGAMNLAVLSAKYNVKRMHQVSTDEVYGMIKRDENSSFKETDPLNPTNPYALSKATADQALLLYAKLHNLDLTISRSTNNFGKYQSKDKLIPLVIFRSLNKMEIPVYGDGKNVRDWIYVVDHCRAIDEILFKGKKGEIYNVSAHEPHTNLEIINFITKRLKIKKDLRVFVEDRKLHDEKYALDTSKIEKELGFKHLYDFEYGLDLTIDFYKEN